MYATGGLSNLVEASSRTGRGPDIALLDILVGPFDRWVSASNVGATSLELLVGSAGASWVLGTIAVAYVVGLVVLWREDRSFLVVLTLPVHGFFAVGFLLGFESTDRAASFLLPWLLVVVASSVRILEGWPRERPLATLRAATAVVVAVLLLGIVPSARLATDWAHTPIEAYRDVIDIAAGAGIEVVVTDSQRPHGFLRYDPDVVLVDADELQHLICGGSDPMVYVSHNFRRDWDPPMDCLEERRAQDVRTSQRRRGTMTVWIVPAR